MFDGPHLQPQGAGPFPTLLDLHGGAWNNRTAVRRSPMTARLPRAGAGGAIDMTLAPEAPYPACVAGREYGVRWLKSKAAGWNGDPRRSASTELERRPRRELLGMRPATRSYSAIPLPSGAERCDGLGTWDALADQQHFARFQNAEEKKTRQHDKEQQTFFVPCDTITRRTRRKFLNAASRSRWCRS